MSKSKKVEEVTISWSTGKKCPVRLVDDVFNEENAVLADTLRECGKGEMPRVLLVADYNVVHYTEGLGSRIGHYFQSHDIKLAGPAVILPGGERVKNDKKLSVERVARAAIEARIGCNDVVLAIGGGCVLDVAGFAAAQIRNGVNLVRMPTTIATQAEGAYTDFAALDEGFVKDAYRLPSYPAAVIVDISFTRTVLDGVWRGGVGECVRYAVVEDSSLYKWIAANAETIMKRDETLARELVKNMIEIRTKKGPNDFAVWCAMRLEAMSNYRLPHGYALGIGSCMEGLYAIERGILKAGDWEDVPRLFKLCGAMQGLSHSVRLFLKPSNVLMGLDAWQLSTGSMARTLPKAIGKSVVEDEPDRAVYEGVISRLADVLLNV